MWGTDLSTKKSHLQSQVVDRQGEWEPVGRTSFAGVGAGATELMLLIPKPKL